jgi:hypothetical protein
LVDNIRYYRVLLGKMGEVKTKAVSRSKQEVITLKVDPSFLDAMKGISNRSEFIRSAVLAALECTCPLCGGSGNLTPNQKAHWDSFAAGHSLDKCTDCHEVSIVCEKQASRPVHGKRCSP